MAGAVYRHRVALSRQVARTIVDGALARARAGDLQPVTVVVLDGGGNLVAAEREDGCGPLRLAVAAGKAQAALGTGTASRVVGARNEARPAFLAAVAATAPDGFVAVAGGVLVLDGEGLVIGAVGVSGDRSDNDEAAAAAGIEAAGLAPGIEP